jgi:hypothetical protein
LPKSAAPIRQHDKVRGPRWLCFAKTLGLRRGGAALPWTQTLRPPNDLGGFVPSSAAGRCSGAGRCLRMGFSGWGLFRQSGSLRCWHHNAARVRSRRVKQGYHVIGLLYRPIVVGPLAHPQDRRAGVGSIRASVRFRQGDRTPIQRIRLSAPWSHSGTMISVLP